MTGTLVMVGSKPFASATKARARHMPKVVMPKNLQGMWTPFWFWAFAALGTVEFAGVEMVGTHALGDPLRASS